LKSNHTFTNISRSEYQKIKEFINQRYKIRVLGKASPGLEESLDILSASIRVQYYAKGKLVFQSSPTNTAYADLVSKIDRKFSLNSIGEPAGISAGIPKDVKYFVGCDESGTGETFGSIFLGCVLVKAGSLKNLERIFDSPDIKSLEEDEINQKYDKIKKYCQIYDERIEAFEIDETSKNTLLDQRYKKLLEKAVFGKEKICIIIDDYEIKRELRSFFDDFCAHGNSIVAESKADERYAACQAASVVARKKRLEEIRNLNKEFALEDGSGGKVCPGAGNAGNLQTEQYLELFLKQNQDKEFPSFVRRKWGNVKKLLQKKSNQSMDDFFGG